MKKIMVVDNEPDIVDLTRTVLEIGGYNVIPVYSGEECLRMLEKENVDLVLLDIMMPGMSGWDVFNRIKKKDDNIKVAFMSVLEISEKRKQVLLDEGLADYTPIFLSQIPSLFKRGMIPIDVALIQTSAPDKNGYVSLGISVDICKAAIEAAKTIIMQINHDMPRVHGDTFINLEDIDHAIFYDEELLEYAPHIPDEIAQQIGKHVAKIVNDED